MITAGSAGAFPSALPGIWAIVFALGVFSSRPYLPRYIGWVGLWYLAGGGFLLSQTSTGFASLGAWLGAVFGIGQLGAALVGLASAVELDVEPGELDEQGPVVVLDGLGRSRHPLERAAHRGPGLGQLVHLTGPAAAAPHGHHERWNRTGPIGGARTSQRMD